jgi:AmmeMemoRadiSam system protein B
MLSPHIDYGRGGATYGAVWARAAAAARAAERVVIIGTDHGGPQGSITLTRQSYATPLGILPTDLETVEALAAAIGEADAFEGELRHRDEHSIELVALWLQHMRGDRPVPTIPILVGGFDHYPRSPEAPEEDPTIRALLATLAELSAKHRTLFVASGDLAHVGPAFGGEPLDAAARARLAGIDGELTTHISHADPVAFLRAIQRFENGNNVCGVSPTWLTMRAVEARQATVCAYRQCPADDQETSWVTIAGALFD